ncbi:helix-turn-helix domain-containing protein [Fredinandcohnia humi]
MEVLTKIANNIKYYRTRSGWTQKELSNRLNVSRSNISKWESGEMTPSLVDLFHLSEIFRITLDNLVGTETMSKEFLLTNNQTQAFLLNTQAELPDVIDYLMHNPLLVKALKTLSTHKPNERRKIEGALISLIKELTT